MSSLDKTSAFGSARRSAQLEPTRPSPTPAQKVVIQPTQPRMPKVGDDLFGFHLKRELGRGAFARVFLAEQSNLAERPVVLKVSRIEGDEAQTLAQLQHTHIVPIHSVHDDESLGLRAVCMPYFGGVALSQVLDVLKLKDPPAKTGADFLEAFRLACRESKPLEGTLLSQLDYFRAVAWIVQRLAEALQHAHQRGVIHCDIKPSNVLIGADGTPMLLDFNVSQSRRAKPDDAVVGGTLAYMAPERRRAIVGDGPIDPNLPTSLQKAVPTDERCDLYSLGVVLYEMLTGVLPYRQPGSILDTPSARAKRSDLPWTLESICRKCQDADPAQRYQNAEELIDDLGRFLRDEPLRFAPELSVRERMAKWWRRHPRLRSSGAVGLVATAVLIGVGTSLISYRNHLEATQEALEVKRAEERRRAYEQGAMQALCLINTHSDVHSHLPQGLALCEKTLGIYGVLDGPHWQQHRDWRRLDREARKTLGEDTRELLMLLAWAKVKQAPQDAGTLKASLELLDRAEAIEDLPASRALWEDRARYHELNQDAERAKTARAKAESIPSATARDYYLLATALARRGQYTAALAELDKALAIHPHHYWSLVQRGICHQELGQLTLAAGDFGACIGLLPHFAFGYFNRGCILEKSGHPVEAIADYTAALERDPHFVLALLNRGMARLELDQHLGALADLKKSLELGRDEASVHLGIGVALERLKRTAEADRAFAQALQRSEKDPPALQIRHQWVYGFAIADRVPTLSELAFDRVLKQAPLHPHALYGKAVLLFNQKLEASAVPILQQIIQNSPTFLPSRRLLALICARRGDFAQASREVNWCLEQHLERGPNLYTAATVAALAVGKAKDAASKQRAASQALGFLQKALDYSYGRMHFADDPDLDAIREQPLFQEWLQKHPPLELATKP